MRKGSEYYQFGWPFISPPDPCVKGDAPNVKQEAAGGLCFHGLLLHFCIRVDDDGQEKVEQRQSAKQNEADDVESKERVVSHGWHFQSQHQNELSPNGIRVGGEFLELRTEAEVGGTRNEKEEKAKDDEDCTQNTKANISKAQARPAQGNTWCTAGGTTYS